MRRLSASAEAKSASTSTSMTRTTTALLQRKCACGGAAGVTGECEGCRKKRLGLQAKLKVNEPGDSYEQEADRVADQVLAAPAHSAVSGAPLRIQRVSASTGQLDAAPASVDAALASPGRSLDPAPRLDMEQRFGHDFSRLLTGARTYRCGRCAISAGRQRACLHRRTQHRV